MSRGPTSAPFTAHDVLQCDVCHADLSDLHGEVCFTRKGQHPTFVIACKRNRCARQRPQCTLYSFELVWFADRHVGLGYLVDTTVWAALTAEQWQRFIQITWACAAVATPEQQRRGRKQGTMMGQIG